MPTNLRPLILIAPLVATALAVAATTGARTEVSQSAGRPATERSTFTDAEIVDGFLKITFGAELRVGGTADRIRRFDRPVRVYVDNRARPDRRADLAAVVADVRARVRHLDIAVTQARSEANLEAILVRHRDLAATIAAIYGHERARQIELSLQPQCLSSLARDEQFRIISARVILVVDAGRFDFFDCAYEELLQALGPNNDTDIPWTMFNDDVRMARFGIYDQYILNILYDPRIRPGMTAADVLAQLPQVLPDVRAWVAKTNGPGTTPEAARQK